MRQYKVFVILIQVILSMQTMRAGFERTAQPTSVLARAYSGVAVFSSDNLWINPASLAHEHELSACTFYCPSPFGLKQLSNYGLILNGTYSSWVFGFGFQSFGFSLYQENTGSLNCGFNISEDISVGTAVHLDHLNIERYGTGVRTVIDAGFIYSMSNAFTIGSAIQNITGSSFGDDDDIPQKISLGIAYRYGEWGMITSDIVKDIRYQLYYNLSIDIYPQENIRLCAGIDSSTSMLTGGAGISILGILISYGVSSHAVLGMTHSIGISFR
ncbi:MAG: hypothetical protein ACOYNS_10260 [Bacteroidota bacterium]